MKKLVMTLVGVAMIAAMPARAGATSISLADTFFPGYGQARHFDTAHEYFGNSGLAYDGVNAPGVVQRGGSFGLTLNTTVWNPGSHGDYEWLSVWVDWNQNRTWEDAERVVDLEDYYMDFGTHPRFFTVNVPNSALLGTTWMRARITLDGPLPGDSAILPSGDAITGEVEDYSMRVDPGGTAPVPEASSVVLLALGALAAAGARTIRRR